MCCLTPQYCKLAGIDCGSSAVLTHLTCIGSLLDLMVSSSQWLYRRTVCYWWQVLTHRKWEERVAGKWAVLSRYQTISRFCMSAAAFSRVIKWLYTLKTLFIILFCNCVSQQLLWLFEYIYMFFLHFEKCLTYWINPWEIF